MEQPPSSEPPAEPTKVLGKRKRDGTESAPAKKRRKTKAENVQSQSDVALPPSEPVSVEPVVPKQAPKKKRPAKPKVPITGLSIESAPAATESTPSESNLVSITADTPMTTEPAAPPAAPLKPRKRPPSKRPPNQSATTKKQKISPGEPAAIPTPVTPPPSTAVPTIEAPIDITATSTIGDSAPAGGAANQTTTPATSARAKETQTGVVVLQPGSLYLRYGFSTQSTPHVMPMAAAYLSRQTSAEEADGAIGGLITDDNPFEPWISEPDTKELADIIERIRQTEGIPSDAQLRTESAGKVPHWDSLPAAADVLATATIDRCDPTHVTTATPQSAAANGGATEAPSSPSSPPSVLAGWEAIGRAGLSTSLLPTASGDTMQHYYRLHWPLRCGGLHTTRVHSLSVVVESLYAIFSAALSSLGVSPNDRPRYTAVLIVGDIVERRAVRTMVDVLLGKLGLGGVAVHQQAVMACFGAGVSSGCVVDIGSYATTIVCVDEGVAVPSTRVQLPYGGEHLTRLMAALVPAFFGKYGRQHAWAHPAVAEPLRRMKESCCHLAPSELAFSDYEYTLDTDEAASPPANGCTRRIRRVTSRRRVNIGAVAVLVPLALFHEKALGPLPPLPRHVAADPEDIFDESFEAAFAAATGATPAQTAQDLPNRENEALVMPLDAAVVESIMRIGGDTAAQSWRGQGAVELRHKMLANIVISGGTGNFRGLAKQLEDRVKRRLVDYEPLLRAAPPQPAAEGAAPADAATGMSTSTPTDGPARVEVVPLRKKVQASTVAWRGGAVLAALEGAADARVARAEWEAAGMRALRAKLMFVL